MSYKEGMISVCPECSGAYFDTDLEGDICMHCKDLVTEARRLRETKLGVPHGWIQWEGTDVCMDVHCICGTHGHIDADFAYFLKCNDCGRVYITSNYVQLIEAEPEEIATMHNIIEFSDEE